MTPGSRSKPGPGAGDSFQQHLFAPNWQEANRNWTTHIQRHERWPNGPWEAIWRSKKPLQPRIEWRTSSHQTQPGVPMSKVRECMTTRCASQTIALNYESCVGGCLAEKPDWDSDWVPWPGQTSPSQYLSSTSSEL